MLIVRDRESSLRRTLMEHWAGVMAWEVRRLEQSSRLSEDRATVAEQNAAIMAKELEKLDVVTKKVEAQERELGKRGGRVQELEAAVQAMKGSELELQKALRSVDDERRQWQQERASLIEEAEQSQGNSVQWDTAREAIANALGLASLRDSSEAIDHIARLRSSDKQKDEELKVMKDEMREVGMGLEEELRRVASERDRVKSELEAMSLARKEAENNRTRSLSEKDDVMKVRTPILQDTVVGAVLKLFPFLYISTNLDR